MGSIRLASVLAVLLGTSFGALSAEPIRKCPTHLPFPGVLPGDPVIVVDGSIWNGGLQGIDALDVHSIEVLCWNPRTGEFEEGQGVSVINILLHLTVAPLRDPLELLLEVQTTYFAEHERYAMSIDELDDFTEGGTGIHFSAHPTGLIAKTGSESDLVRCEIYFGEGVNEVLPRVGEGHVTCRSNHALPLAAIREAYFQT